LSGWIPKSFIKWRFQRALNVPNSDSVNSPQSGPERTHYAVEQLDFGVTRKRTEEGF
jgi:hypothetical protein